MRAKPWRQGFLIGLMLVGIAWLASLIWGLAGKAHVAVSEANQAKSAYQELEQRKATLEANLAALKTERGEDAAIRTAFGVAKEGEEVIVVVPPTSTGPTSTPSWWERLFGWF